MRKIYLLLVLCIAFLSSVETIAQEKCHGSKRKLDKLQDPQVAQRVADIEAFTQRWIQENQHVTQRAIITIPVVVHVLYKNATTNIDDTQIQSQFTVLNDDFRKLNANFSNTPAQFQGVAADTEIEFCLASVDPDGNPTTGITRTSVANNFDIEYDYFDPNFGGKAPWDNTKYLNVWIGDLGNSGLLGFATPPGTATAPNNADDGSVIDYRSWGTSGTVVAPNDLGRTATHEFGHYLNLEHVWGLNGGCNDDDLVADTPNQNDESGGCETFPYFDNCTTSGDGIMFMNYMDYSDDACMTMFTAGQKARMLAALNGPRSGLLTSLGCSLNASDKNELNIPVRVMPNPAQSFVTISATFNDELTIELFNTIGEVVKTDRIQAGEKQITINTSDLTSGVYFIKMSSDELYTTKKLLIID